MNIRFKDYLPLVYIYILTVLTSILVVMIFSLNFKEGIYIFLGIFSLVFSVLKLVRLKDFVEALSEYDLFSQRFRIYGYLFPFLEFLFGVSFLLRLEFLIIEFFCLILFSLNLVSVIHALQLKRKFICACLGDLIKLPLSYVSLIENLTMILGIIYLIGS